MKKKKIMKDPLRLRPRGAFGRLLRPPAPRRVESGLEALSPFSQALGPDPRREAGGATVSHSMPAGPCSPSPGPMPVDGGRGRSTPKPGLDRGVGRPVRGPSLGGVEVGQEWHRLR